MSRALARGRAQVLLDLDGDGFPDALDGRVWIGTADVDAAVEAAAELLGALAARALVLPIETVAWPTPRPALFLGREPPTAAAVASWRGGPVGAGSNAEMGTSTVPSGLLLTAPDGAGLRRAARSLAAELRHEADAASARAPGREPPSDPPSGPAAAGALQDRLTLGSVLSGDGVFSGSRLWPDAFVGGFAASGSVPAALEVAARLATEGLTPPARVWAAPDAARVRTLLDSALAADSWEVRVVRRGERDVLEVAGADADALARACRVVARSFPRLPDGRSLDELEPDLERFLRLETRAGRLAAAAVLGADDVAAFELPYPGSDAPRRLGAPVRNVARAGARHRWSRSVPWEGERLIAATAELTLPAGGYRLEAYASETLAVRQQLAQALHEHTAGRGRPAHDIVVRHATKPALHWLLEEVEPALPAATVALSISVGSQEAGYGPPERWLRELYPAAELLEAARPGLTVELTLRDASGPPSYLAVARDDDAHELQRSRLTPLLASSSRPDGAPALVTTGGVRLLVGDAVVQERRVATDREVVWSFLLDEVFPSLTALAGQGAPPFLHEIAVVVQASEPDDRWPLDHETDSVLEGLHEDIYFGLLEAFGRARPEVGPRRLAPARILPFCRARPGTATQVEVIARQPGGRAVAAVTAAGDRIAAAPLRARVRAVTLRGRGREPEALAIEVDGPDAQVAVARLTWAARAGLDAFPRELALSFHGGPQVEQVDALRPLAEPFPAGLPARPLHPHEVASYLRSWAAAEPRLHLRVANESVLGQPLLTLECGHPAGPAVSRARRAALKPTVLLSARQHANEPTSTPAALELARSELARPRFTTHLNLVVQPLENPDGARLHAALCSLAPNHMHHAARYTAFGADLQADPEIDGRLIGESAQRHQTWRRWRPAIHLNNHGYPAHEWVRPQSGYLPPGFENWSLPVGHLTILTLHGRDDAAARALLATLRRRIAAALDDAPQVALRTRAQAERAARYRPASATPFRFERGLPFWEQLRPPADAAGPAPALVVITEVPDETVTGARWDACVLAHQLIDETVLAALVLATVGTDGHGAEADAAEAGLALLRDLARPSRPPRRH